MDAQSRKSIAPEELLDISDSRRDATHRSNDDLIQIIKDYADKLAADRATRGDLKVVSRALRELRFSDILVEGQFEQTKALKGELDESDLVDLPRLVFSFNRRNLGRLRQLIDCINRGQVG